MIYNNGEVEQIRESLDLDGQVAHPASDERLEELRQQGANGALQQRTVTVSNMPPDANTIPDGALVEVQAHANNSGVVYVGDSNGQDRALAPREFVDRTVDDLADIHARGTADDQLVLSWTEAQ